MSALLVHPTLGRATACTAMSYHNPWPVRIVWHHVYPQECGGQTNINNLIAVCDNCHYLIHDLLWVLARDQGSTKAWGRHGSHVHRQAALTGYLTAVQQGTLHKVPNEGGML